MRNERQYIPFPILIWQVATQPFWTIVEKLVSLGLRIGLRRLGIQEESKYGKD